MLVALPERADGGVGVAVAVSYMSTQRQFTHWWLYLPVAPVAQSLPPLRYEETSWSSC